MRKTFWVLGIAALTLTACDTTAEQEDSTNQSDGDLTDSNQLRVYGGIQVDSENTVYDGEDLCVVSDPYITSAMKDLAGTQVKIINAEGTVEGVAQFQTDFNDAGCSWYFETNIEGTSDFYKAEFLDYETETVSTNEAGSEGLMLDPVASIADEVDRKMSEDFIDTFPGN